MSHSTVGHKEKSRNIRVIELSDLLEGKIYTQNIALKLSVLKTPIDVGALSYVKRKKSSSWHYIVDKKYLNKQRTKRLSQWLDCISIEKSYGKKDSTIKTQINSCIRFIKYCEKEKHSHFLNSKKACQNAYRDYTVYLNYKMREGIYSQAYAGLEQSYTESFIEQCFGMPPSPILSGMQKIKKHSPTADTAAVHEDSVVLRDMLLLDSIFTSITEFCLLEKKYPAQIKIREKLKWIFPHKQWILNETGSINGCTSRVYDYEKGNILSYEEAKTIYSAQQAAMNAVNSATDLLESANSDLRHPARIRLAMRAHDAFVMMFIAISAMNLAGVMALKWDKDYEIVRDSVEFRTIKYRAGGRECSFTIEAKFLSYLRKYLKLREYILGGVGSKWLFFRILSDGDSDYSQISKSFTWETRTKIRNDIDRDWSLIGAREWRATKGDIYQRNTDISTTARVLQNSERTVRKNYSTGSPVTTTKEMSNFWNDGFPLLRRNPKYNEDTPMAACRSYGNPEPVLEQRKQPDCKTWEGCIGCKNYAYHADSIDVRKLLSAREVVLSTKHLSNSLDEFEANFKYFLSRVASILMTISELSESHAQMVELVSAEVRDGKYDEYWLRKYEMLLSIGVISE